MQIEIWVWNDGWEQRGILIGRPSYNSASWFPYMDEVQIRFTV